MLRLTSSEVTALKEEWLLTKICSMIEKTLPHRLPTGQSMRETASRLVRVGEDYGVRGERGLARFVCLALISGEHSVREPGFVQQFRQSRKSADRVVNQLLREIAGKERRNEPVQTD